MANGGRPLEFPWAAERTNALRQRAALEAMYPTVAVSNAAADTPPVLTPAAPTPAAGGLSIPPPSNDGR